MFRSAGVDIKAATVRENARPPRSRSSTKYELRARTVSLTPGASCHFMRNRIMRRCSSSPSAFPGREDTPLLRADTPSAQTSIGQRHPARPAIRHGLQFRVQCSSLCTCSGRTLLQTLSWNSAATNPRASRMTTPSRSPPSADGSPWACSMNARTSATDRKRPLNSTGTTGISRYFAYASTSVKAANAPAPSRNAKAWKVACSTTGSYSMLCTP